MGELILQSWGERVNRVNQRLRIEDYGLSFLRDQQLRTNSASIP